LANGGLHCPVMVIKITNKTGKTVRAWVTSHDLFPGSQCAWCDLRKDVQETWNRSAANKVTIEVSGKEYTHQSSGSSTLEVRDGGIYSDGKLETSFGSSAKLDKSSHCSNGVYIKNETGLMVRAWVTSHDVCPGSQIAWCTLAKGCQEYWNRSSNNTVTIEVEGHVYAHQTAGTPGDMLFVKADGVYLGKKCVHPFSFIHAIVVASSPVTGLDGSDYKERLCALEKTNTNVKMGIDWPGAATAEGDDAPIFDEMNPFKQVYVDKSKPDDEREKAFENIKRLVKSTKWWLKYTGLVFQGVRMAIRSNPNVELVCIQGGPISNVECSEMEGFKEKLLGEARKCNIKDASIEVKVFGNFEEFERSL